MLFFKKLAAAGANCIFDNQFFLCKNRNPCFIYNQVGGQTMKDFPKTLQELQKNTPKILTIDNSSNDEVIIPVFEILSTNTSVTKVCLTYCTIEESGMVAISNALKKNNSIECIELRECMLTEDDIEILCEALKLNKSIKFLNLSCNNIENGGADALSKLLKINTSLEDIDIGENSIEADGVKMLADALMSNTSLKMLDLSNNIINHEGVIALSNVLKSNTSLRYLGLRACLMGMDDSAHEFSEALKINTTLETLDLRENYLADDDVQALSEALKINTTLEALYLNENEITALGKKAIKEALSINYTLFSCEYEDPSPMAPELQRNHILYRLFNAFENTGLIQLNSPIPKLSIDLLSKLGLDSSVGLTLRTGIEKLEVLFPILSDEHHVFDSTDYLTESYRLLKAFEYMLCSSDVASRCALNFLLKTSFTHPQLLARADKALALLLISDELVNTTFSKATPEQQIARYQWILHGMKDYRDEPGLRAFSENAFAGLFYQRKVKQQDRQSLIEDTILLYREELLNHIDTVWHELDSSPAANLFEKNLLGELLKSYQEACHFPHTIFWLSQSPAFIAYISATFPHKSRLILIENLIYDDKIEDLKIIDPVLQLPITQLNLEIAEMQMGDHHMQFSTQEKRSRIKSLIESVTKPLTLEKVEGVVSLLTAQGIFSSAPDIDEEKSINPAKRICLDSKTY